MRKKGIFATSCLVLSVFALLFNGFSVAASDKKPDTKSIQPFVLEPNIAVRESVVFENQSLFEKAANAETLEKKRDQNSTENNFWDVVNSTQLDIASKPGVKLYVNQNSWYRVPAATLQSAGFDTVNNREKWQLFVDATEVPMVVNADGSIEFYGRGDDTIYTDSNVYYLFVGDTDGERVASLPGGVGGSPDSDSFLVEVKRRDRQFYMTSILNGEDENWFGSVVSSTPAVESLDLRNVDNDGDVVLDVKLQGITSASHLVNVYVNDVSVGVVSFDGMNLHSQSFTIPNNVVSEGLNEFKFQAVGAGSDFSLIESFSVRYPKTYAAISNRLNFGVSAGETAQVNGFTESGTEVYEISGGEVLHELDVEEVVQNGTYGFNLPSSSFDREFIAVTDAAAPQPFKIEPNTPSTLTSANNYGKLAIISPPEFAAQAQILADWKTSRGMPAKVVLTDDIADEFGYGDLTAEALYVCFQQLAKSWTVRAQYILLFGDSSYDMKDYLGHGRNFIPTKLIETFDMETASDGWLADFTGDGIEDLGIGRIPVANQVEAADSVAKIIRYESENLNTPPSAMLAADSWFETLNGYIEERFPANYSTTRIERNTLGTAAMRSAILEEANNDHTIVTYSGHGTTGNWTNGGVLNLNDPANMTNAKLPFYVLMTCLNGFSHNASNSSLAENLVLAENGAVAAWASSGSTYASGQIWMSLNLVEILHPTAPKQIHLGEAVLEAKRFTNDMDARRTWQLFGDPTLIIR
ncbi:MAG: hypothetical protein HKN33_16700 [Pyrinomonadaceae bacterium]|nr:hypothetical protein [Pyrinomonadaceae bacterium]